MEFKKIERMINGKIRQRKKDIIDFKKSMKAGCQNIGKILAGNIEHDIKMIRFCYSEISNYQMILEEIKFLYKKESV